MRLDEAKLTRKQPDYADGNNDHYCSHRNQAACALLMPTRRRQRRVSRRRMVVRWSFATISGTLTSQVLLRSFPLSFSAPLFWLSMTLQFIARARLGTSMLYAISPRPSPCTSINLLANPIGSKKHVRGCGDYTCISCHQQSIEDSPRRLALSIAQSSHGSRPGRHQP